MYAQIIVPAVYPSEQFGRPRIAAPPSFDYSPHHITDYMIVVDYYYVDGQNGTWKILGYNRFSNVPLNNILLNNGIQSRSNTSPVITYCGDIMNVSWTSYVYNNGALANEVVSRQIYSNGILANNTISVVNFFTTEYQYLPSISGRFAENTNNLYFYCNEAMTELQFKTAGNASIQLRKKHENKKIVTKFYVSDNQFIEIESLLDDFNITIYNSIGQSVYANTTAKDLKRINITALAKGSYIVILQNSNTIETYKFIKY